jgi:hypothetical protein
LQIRKHFAQREAQSGQRRPPADMPSQAPPRKPPVTAPLQRNFLPKQQPVTDTLPTAAPSRWKRVLKRALAILGIILALSIAYIFLLMGEPGEDDQLTAQNAVQEEIIRVPIAATQASSDADLNLLAANFGKPVLALYSSDLTLQKATLYDTAFRGGYARRLTLQYAFSDGSVLIADSIRPTAAVELLKDSNYSLNVNQLYSLAGMDAVRMDTSAQACLIARGSEAVYAIRCPAQHATELAALIKQASLMQGTAQ